MKIAIGSDEAGYALKEILKPFIVAEGHEVADFGTFDGKPVLYPDIAHAVAVAVAAGEQESAVLICGTGIGMAITANKVKGIRAAVCHDVHSAHQSVEHDDVNVMCIGAQIVGPWLARDLISAFLAARFSTDPDMRRRVAKLHAMDAGT